MSGTEQIKHRAVLLLSQIKKVSSTLFPKISKNTFIFLIFSSLFYFISLYPSRNHLDTVIILELARQGKSLDQWTALYFRFLDLLSLGGLYPMIPALFGLVSLALSFLFFISSVNLSPSKINLVAKVFLLSPFIGVFGMTLTHEVQSTSGVLILLGMLIRRTNSQSAHYRDSRILLVVSGLLVSMIYTGFLIFLGFMVSMFLTNIKSKKFMLLTFMCMTCITLFGSSFLGVTPASKALRFQSFLGDIKCITQHPDAKISNEEWKTLLSYGSREEWTAPSTCAYSQVYFAFPKVESDEKNLLRLWIKLVSKNPQLGLEARIQRASIALPPPLFTAPQTSIQVDYLQAAGAKTKDDLLVWSVLFKTSNDDAYQKSRFETRSFSRILESIAILPAHLMNRNSSLWGWGGLWLTLATIFMYLSGLYSFRSILIILVPQYVTALSLVLFSPLSDPRYGMSITLPSITLTVLCFMKITQSMRAQSSLDAN